MRLSDFDYSLPKGLIAQYPSGKRDDSRLMVLDRKRDRIEHRTFKDIVGYFSEGDFLLLNDTKVVPARLFGRKETGGKVEALVLQPHAPSFDLARGRDVKCRSTEREVLLKPARGCKLGARLAFGGDRLKAEVVRIENGRRFLRFECKGTLEEELDGSGEMPLPPYIKRRSLDSDTERYQTVYAARKGAVAAPTAGLHFTQDTLAGILKKGVDMDYVTLHVGYGTFKPVKCEDIARHRMEKEYFEVKKGLTRRIKAVKGRVIAVGTTTCRVLETIAARPFLHNGWTYLFIRPPYRFKATNVLLTNFHLPRTTLLMLVSAFCGKELLFKAYKEAIKKRYRFYSYGDAMLIL